MRSVRGKLLSSTFIPIIAGAGVAVGTAIAEPSSALAVTAAKPWTAPLPAAKRKLANFQLVACNPCNPCAAKNPCNPCAAKNPCNPCAAANPCNPCAAGGGAVSEKCMVPRLASAAKGNPCNPCAAKNPCNPCAAKYPCAAANPCGAANPCNPCNPCGAVEFADITSEEAETVYACLRGDMAAAHAKAGLAQVQGYQQWTNVAAVPYQSATHGSRYVNNYANATGAPRYSQFEEVGTMPSGSVIAKDSFVANTNGTVAIGPLFIMEKMPGGFNAGTHDWRYTMVMPNGAVFGTTGGDGSASVQFCAECHAAVAESADSLFFLPEEFRAKF